MAVVMTLYGNSQAEYDAVMAILDVENDPPPGAICHAACVEEDGRVFVTDVWETQADIDTFFETRLGKALAEVGAEISPPTFRETHYVFCP